MGFIEKREDKKIPDGMQYLYDTYKDIRFSVTNKNKLVPREALDYHTLNDYMLAMQFSLSPAECAIMLSIDAIFNQSTQG